MSELISVSNEKFGKGPHTDILIRKIAAECVEVLAKPDDLEEWLDVIILAMDGYWRHGGDPIKLLDMLYAKLKVVQGRKYKQLENGTFQHVGS